MASDNTANWVFIQKLLFSLQLRLLKRDLVARKIWLNTAPKCTKFQRFCFIFKKNSGGACPRSPWRGRRSCCDHLLHPDCFQPFLDWPILGYVRITSPTLYHAPELYHVSHLRANDLCCGQSTVLWRFFFLLRARVCVDLLILKMTY